MLWNVDNFHCDPKEAAAEAASSISYNNPQPHWVKNESDNKQAENMKERASEREEQEQCGQYK